MSRTRATEARSTIRRRRARRRRLVRTPPSGYRRLPAAPSRARTADRSPSHGCVRVRDPRSSRPGQLQTAGRRTALEAPRVRRSSIQPHPASARRRRWGLSGTRFGRHSGLDTWRTLRRLRSWMRAANWCRAARVAVRPAIDGKALQFDEHSSHAQDRVDLEIGARSVGWVTTAASGRQSLSSSARVPIPPASSSGTAATITSPRNPSTAAAAAIAAAIPPLMSYAPRPTSRPSCTRGGCGSAIAPGPTV